MPDSRPVELFRFTSEVMPEDTFQVARFHGTEGLNTLFSFTIDLVSQNSQVDQSKLLSAPAAFYIHRVDAPDTVFRGYLAGIRQGGQYHGYTYYTVELRPAFWKLSLIKQSAIFLNKTPAEVADELLNSQTFLPISHESRLSCDYPSPEFSMQYEESIYDYVVWRMEEQGAYYYFAQDADRVIFADGSRSHDEASFSVIYSPTTGLEGNWRDEVLTSFDLTQTPLPQRLVVRTFNWKDPSTAVAGSAMVDAQNGVGVVYLNNENVESNSEAERIAKIRAEELICRSRVFTGTGAVPSLRPGVTFTLKQHYNPAFNRDYMVTHITHEGGQESFLTLVLGIPLRNTEEHLFYRNSFSCIEADVTYRPARTAPRASIPGVIRAFVDGCGSGSRAEIDEYGRYKLIFPFDMSDRKDGNATCWIRMAREQVGKDSGLSFPLLPGVEVTVAFLGGNPDRPVITGALPNGNTGAITGSGNSNFSGIRTSGGNQITINDTDKQQGISLLSASGNGISFGDGSPNTTTITSDNVISAVGVASSDVAGMCKNFVTGFRTMTAAMQYDATCLSLWNTLTSTLFSAASDTMAALSTSSSDSSESSSEPTSESSSESSTESTSEPLSWGSTAANTLATLIPGILQIIYAAKKGKTNYNVSLTGSKHMAGSIIQVAPSKTKLIIAIVSWLGARLVEEVSKDISETKAATDKDDKTNWSQAIRSYVVSGTSLISDIVTVVCTFLSTAADEDSLGGISLLASDSNVNLSAKKTVSAHSNEGIYLRTNEDGAGRPPQAMINSDFGKGTDNRTTLPNNYEGNVSTWSVQGAAPSFNDGYIALDTSLICEQTSNKLSRVEGTNLSRANTHITRSGKNTVLIQKDGNDAGIQIASEEASISLDVKNKATAALNKDGVLLVSNKTGLMLDSNDSGAAVLKADTGTITLVKDKILLSTSKANIFCGDDIRLKAKSQTQIQDLFIKSNTISGKSSVIKIGTDAIKVTDSSNSDIDMSEDKSSTIKTRYEDYTKDNGMIGAARESVKNIPTE